MFGPKRRCQVCPELLETDVSKRLIKRRVLLSVLLLLYLFKHVHFWKKSQTHFPSASFHVCNQTLVYGPLSQTSKLINVTKILADHDNSICFHTLVEDFLLYSENDIISSKHKKASVFNSV